MYSRYGNHSNRPVRLPEHYGGSAFSQPQLPTEPIPVPKQEPTRSFVRDSIEEKVSPVADRLMRAEANEEKDLDIPETPALPETIEKIVEEKEEIAEKSSPPPLEKKPSSLPFHFDGLRRLFGGGEGEGDQDRLLLLGLILLLSRTEGDSDILLWLSLLLLCG